MRILRAETTVAERPVAAANQLHFLFLRTFARASDCSAKDVACVA